MKSIQELAMEYADRHEEAELNLRGLGGIYGYNRIVLMKEVQKNGINS